jgi:hypothetical protein
VLTYGDLPVPFAASWSSEDRTFVGMCRFSRRPAICQAESPGEGKPIFGTPHFVRQRQVISEGRCDLCGKPLRNSTKVSLSHARPIAHSARGGEILQVEPLLHKECAAISMRHCPSLKRDIAAGTLMVRQVLQHDVQFAISDPIFVSRYVPDYKINPNDRIVAHAKVHLIKWKDRDAAWLGAGL